MLMGGIRRKKLPLGEATKQRRKGFKAMGVLVMAMAEAVAAMVMAMRTGRAKVE